MSDKKQDYIYYGPTDLSRFCVPRNDRKQHIIDCKLIRYEMVKSLKNKALTKEKKLAIIQVLGDAASDTYTKNKVLLAQEIGIECDHYTFAENIPYIPLQRQIRDISQEYHGCILQLPLPAHLKPFEQMLLDTINYPVDVDGLSTVSIGKLHSGNPYHKPCTAQACLDVLSAFKYDLTGKNVLIIGRQNLLGLPLQRLMIDANATVTLAHSYTQNLQEMLSSGRFDVVVSAIGRPRFLNHITTDFILDVGINRDEHGKLCGDVNLDTCIFDYATTVGGGYGGIGALTVVNLMKNTLEG